MSTTQDQNQSGEPRTNPRRWLKMTLALDLLVVLAAGGVAYWIYFMKGVVFSDDARIDGNLVDVAPQIGGLLTEVAVREGESVSNRPKASAAPS